MSSNLHWRLPEPEGKSFGYQLKFALREYWGGGIVSDWSILNQHDLGFLRGLVAGAGPDSETGKEAQFLIDKIQKHGAVTPVGVDACCIHTARTALRCLPLCDDGDTIHCNTCPTILELHGRIWLNQHSAPARTSLA